MIKLDLNYIVETLMSNNKNIGYEILFIEKNTSKTVTMYLPIVFSNIYDAIFLRNDGIISSIENIECYINTTNTCRYAVHMSDNSIFIGYCKNTPEGIELNGTICIKFISSSEYNVSILDKFVINSDDSEKIKKIKKIVLVDNNYNEISEILRRKVFNLCL